MSGEGSNRSPLKQDAVAGLIVVALGIAILVALSRIGGAKYQQIPPDLFPRVCAYALVAGGCLLFLRGLLKGGARFELPRLRGLAPVVLGVILFGLLTPAVGYAPAGLALMVVSGLAAPEVRWRQLLLVSLGLIAFSIVLFSLILKLPLPIISVPGLRL